MKYLDVSIEGDGYKAVLSESELPVPGRDEMLVKVAGSGLNRADLSQIAGHYPPPSGESEILGMEVSGTVVETGEPICALLAGGGHAEYVAVPRGQMFPVPAGLEILPAAAIPEAFLTAFLNLAIEGELRRRGLALVHAGASGVGLAAIQTAKYLGAPVAATTRSRSKLAAMEKAGADLAIDTSAASAAAAIEKAWGPDAIDVVFDPVGAETMAVNLRVLAPGGRIILLSTLSGARAELDIALLLKKRARVVGSTLRVRSREAKAGLVARFRAEMLPGFGTGALSVSVDSVFPPVRAAEAFQRMKENRNAGKILIDWR